MSDERTIDVYNAKAEQYAKLVQKDSPDQHLQAFIDALPKGGIVLDLGCGPAAASNFMRTAGLTPDPIDASVEMVRVANETFNIGARVATFDDINGAEIYDGIWANFSLLHASRADLRRHLEALVKSLKTKGVFHIGMKTGEGAKRDGIDRLYTYVTPTELEGLLSAAGLEITTMAEGAEEGLDGVMANWVIFRAVKHG